MVLKTAVAFFVAIALGGSPLGAAPVELGIQVAGLVSQKPDGKDRHTRLGVPDAGQLYLLWLWGGHASLGPYFSFSSRWDEPNVWESDLGLLASYYPRGHRRPGLYAEAQLGGYFLQGKREDVVAGGGIGYQIPRGRFVWRVQADYARCIEYETNHTSLSLSIGRRGR